MKLVSVFLLFAKAGASAVNSNTPRQMMKCFKKWSPPEVNFR